MDALNIKPAVPSTTIENWDSIQWTSIEKYVRKLQQRIFNATKQGKNRKTRGLQRLLIRGEASLLLSIRTVTQINKGKRSAGIDGYKALTPDERMDLFLQMKSYSIASHHPKPVKRLYIPKKNKKLRPLCIPTIRDRVYQNVVKLALEPEWEAKFEPISYGFRPKRSAHDAMEAIYNKLAPGKKQWIFEGDFKGCFDNLNHEYILKQLAGFPGKDIIGKWLRAGYLENGTFHATPEGTPQGGIISPLLANIALHGMEEAIGVKYKVMNRPSRGGVRYEVKSSRTIVRYADDFVIICESEEEAHSMYEVLKPYLKERGLELAKDKTSVVHVTEGFDFLGFNVRRYEYTKNTGTQKSKLFIKPSKESLNKTREKLSEKMKYLRGANISTVIAHLNPILRGVANYWSPQVSKDAFTQIDHHVVHLMYKHLKGIHPNKSWTWIKEKYLGKDKHGISKNKWIFTCPVRGNQLWKMEWKAVVRHELIRHNYSPFDESLKEYFTDRDIKEFKRVSMELYQKLAKKRSYKCSLCGNSLFDEEGIEIHHSTPRVQGGKNMIKNMELVHISCHIDHHKLHPAKGPIPTDAELEEDKKQRRLKRNNNLTL